MKIKDVVLGIAIIILTIFVAYYGINTIFPKPNYEDFCKNTYVQKVVETTQECESMNGTWIVQNIECIKAPCPQGYCDLYSKCSKEFNDVDRERSKKVFFIALPLGILIICVGAFFFGLEAVGAGLMGGGLEL